MHSQFMTKDSMVAIPNTVDPDIYKAKTMETQQANIKNQDTLNANLRSLKSQPGIKDPQTIGAPTKELQASTSKPKLPPSASRKSLVKDIDSSRLSDNGTSLADSFGNRRDSEVPEGIGLANLKPLENISSTKTIESQHSNTNGPKLGVIQSTPITMPKPPTAKKIAGVATNAKESILKPTKGTSGAKTTGMKK